MATINISVELKNRFKQVCRLNNVSLKEVTIDLIKDYIKRYEHLLQEKSKEEDNIDFIEDRIINLNGKKDDFTEDKIVILDEKK